MLITDRRRADPHRGRRDPRDGPRHAGRDADRARRRREARRPRAHRGARRRTATATATDGDGGNGGRRAGDGDIEPEAPTPPSTDGALMSRIFNFSAGPAMLPAEVLARAGDEMLDWHGSGMSVMEMSHRGKEFIAIARRGREPTCASCSRSRRTTRCCSCRAARRRSSRIVPMNLLRGKGKADYVNTGEWSKKAIEEAKTLLQGQRRRERRGRRNFTYVPTQCDVEARRRTRPTCTTAPTRPSAASSSTGRPTPATCRWWPTCRRTSCRGRSTSRKFGLIYAGAQKNIGPAGLTHRHRARRPDRPGAAGHAERSSTTSCRPTPTRCSTRRRPTRSTSPGWCSSG